ncbi:hypothetical protein ACFP3Q_00990 [Nocardioides sp. GCM10027113]|uniref:hypothetical protein n=1 Tax=unclassified Nocardioides TaxID=2615069 RepID=UPI0036116167
MEPQDRIRRVGRAKAVLVALSLSGSAALAGGLAAPALADLQQVNGQTTTVVPADQHGSGVSHGSGGPAHSTTRGS